MKTERGAATKNEGHIRSLSRKGGKTGKTHPAETRSGRYKWLDDGSLHAVWQASASGR